MHILWILVLILIILAIFGGVRTGSFVGGSMSLLWLLVIILVIAAVVNGVG